MASRNCNIMIIIPLLQFTFIFALCFFHSEAKFHRLEHAANSDQSLSVLVVGDWGRKGFYNQSKVAAQMGIIGEKLDIDFVISTGDNFYEDGLTGEDDPAFEESFSKIYTAPSLQKQWYNEVVDFFFIDSTPFVKKYFTHPKDHKYDWRDVLPREEYLKNQLEDLDSVLKESNGKWKVVIGHHTLQSAGNHGSTPELVDRLLPVLQENNVDLYVNGHDHCLEHISSPDSPLQFLTSGGGSKAWKNVIHPWDAKTLKFYYDGQGFMSMHLTKDEVEIKFYDILGNVLHQWSASKGYYFM